MTFKIGDRVRFRYWLLGQEGCEGTVEEITPAAGEFSPALLRVRLDRGPDWWAVLDDWELVSRWRKLVEQVKGLWNGLFL